MRVEVKTGKPIKDPDIKALYLMRHALEMSSSEKMRAANLRFILDGEKQREASDGQG